MKRISEIIKILQNNPSARLSEFRKIPINKQGFVLLSLYSRLQKSIFLKLENEEVVSLVHYLDPDETTDLLQILSLKKQKEVLEKMNKEVRDKVSLLLRFDAHTAGGLVSLDYIQIDFDEDLSGVMEKIKDHEKKTGKFPVVLVMKNGRLSGVLPNDRLIFSTNKDLVKILTKKVIKIKHSVGYRKILELFKRNPHKKMVVLNDDGSVLGVIYSDDVLRLLHENEGGSLYDFAGVSGEESVFDRVFVKVNFRYKWLILNLFTAFLAACVVSLFKGTIEKYVLLAVYMPIVAGMGGNAATQTLVVMVRGLALKQVDLRSALPVIFREIGAGFINGFINGLIVAVVAWLWNGVPLLGLVFGVAIMVNLMVAGLFGTLIPLVMQRLGRDPASSATVFITMATDIFGFFVFLGLASLVL
jgi:magnesium transporter